jgi:hypothetical protein
MHGIILPANINFCVLIAQHDLGLYISIAVESKKNYTVLRSSEPHQWLK